MANPASPLAVLAAIAVCAAGVPPTSSVHAAGAPDVEPVPAAGVSDSAAAGGRAAAAASLPWRLEPRQNVVSPAADAARALVPSGVTTDAFGRVWVADEAAHRILWYSPDGTRLGEAGTLGSDPGQFRRPTDLVRLGSLGVAVLDVENRRVVSYDLFGRLLGVLVTLDDPSLRDAVGRVDPVGLAADRGGALMVADRDRDRVLAFDFSGAYLRTLGGVGSRPGSFRGLSGLALGPRGELVTAERTGARIQRLDAGGRVIGSWPLAVAPAPGALPVAVDDSARVAVADETGGTLRLFARDGRLLARLDGLARPTALAFAPDGTLLVAEAGAGSVRRFALVPAPAVPDAPEE